MRVERTVVSMEKKKVYLSVVKKAEMSAEKLVGNWVWMWAEMLADLTVAKKAVRLESNLVEK